MAQDVQRTPQRPQAQEGRQSFIQGRLPSELTAHITGNVPIEIKELPVKWLSVFRNKGTGFAGPVSLRMKVVDVSAIPSPDDPLKIEGKVTVEIDVTPDMCNERGVLDEGCIVYLVDECSTTAMAIANAVEGKNRPPGVSQTINTMYHAPASAGTKLRIINTSLAAGDYTNAGRTEIWDTKNHRIVASGTQITATPSRPHALPPTVTNKL